MGRSIKEKDVPIAMVKGKDVPPKKQRLKAKPQVSDTSGKPVKEKKMRILSVKGDDMQFVLE